MTLRSSGSRHVPRPRPTPTDEAHEVGWKALGTLATACTVVTAITALYMLLVAFGNVTDYGTNLAFVQHVLLMDTTNFGAGQGMDLDPDVMWRAISSPAIHTIVYVALIAWEVLTAVVLLVATWRWLTARGVGSFGSARRISTIGYSMVVILFFGGFITIGGEWFQMWRSVEWNGLEPAFRNAVLALLGLVLVHLPGIEQ